MPNLFDVGMLESTLFELYRSKGYDDLLIALKIAEAQIVARMEKIPDDSWTRKRLAMVKSQIDQEIGEAYGGLFASMQDESVSIATITAGAMLGDTLYKLPKSTVQDIIKSNRPIQMASDKIVGDSIIKAKKKEYGFKELFKITENDHAKRLKIVIASGVAQGLTTKQIVKDFELKNSQLSKGQVVSNIFTVITDSRNQGNYQSYKELERLGVIEYYEHVSVLDSHTSLEICVPRDQRRYYQPIDKISSTNKPPLHGNCRSKLISRTKNTLGDTRPSMNGEIPTTRYPAWFKKQPDWVQRKVLGKNKYELYKKGQYEIRSLEDVKGKRLNLSTIESAMARYVGE